ncbi:MAG: sigma-54 dependent transcriptional regulator [Desulfurivibrio sp.]|nr:sigma-54 dependent transcriptional regulator [Desulfurivibrio sp.]
MEQDTAEPREKIMIVEDDAGLRRLLAEELSDAGLEVEAVADGATAWQQLPQWQPDLVLSDLRLPGLDGMELLAQIRQLPLPQPAVIIITAFGTVPQAVEALKLGADDFLTKPLDLDHLLLCVNRTLENRRLRAEVQRFRQLLAEDDFHGIIGRSTPMRQLFNHITQVAGVDSPVLLTGESGVGKELVAHALHRESSRGRQQLVAVNCAGIPGELVESEFFGHVAGAFSGAQKERRGLFVEADGSTLLLDEIGEMPLGMQAKLLRVLEEGMIRPVGSDRELAVEVRIIAASNRDLEEEVAAGRFRQDLYYRLETFRLEVPPLRQRGDDLDLLAARFIELFATAGRRPARGISPAALACLRRYPFPGNVRELRNALERAVTFCPGREITPDHLPTRIRHHGGTPNATAAEQSAESAPPTAAADSLAHRLLPDDQLPSLEELGNRYIQLVLEQLDGNKRQAAQVLGIGRRTLYRRL